MSAKFERGNRYICTQSASPGYKVNKIYTAFKDEKDNVCLQGDDGYTDICSMLVSKFRKV